jgi:O-antigen ligase
VKKFVSSVPNETCFPRDTHQQFYASWTRLDAIAFAVVPFLLIAFFVSLGVASASDNLFGTIMLLLGLAVLIQKKGIAAPSSVKVMYYTGIALFAMVVVHAIVGNNIEMLFKFQFENLRNMLILPLIAVLLSVVRFNAQGVWRLIVLAGLYTVVMVGAILIEQPARGTGVLSEAIVVGNLGMLFGLLSLVAVLGLQGKWWKTLALLVFVSGVMLSMLSQTRAGWVAFIIAIFLLMWAFWGIKRKTFFVVLTGVVVFTIGMWLFWDRLPIEGRIMQAVMDIERYFEGNSNSSVGARLDMWKITLHAFTEYPVFGWGVTPFKETFVNYLNQGVGSFNLSAGDDGFAQPHNDYMFLLYHFGLVGLGLALTLLLFPVYVLLKIVKQAKNEQNYERVYLALTGLIAIEALLDFMMFNLALMNKIFYVAVIVVFMVLFALHSQTTKSVSKC